MITYIQKLTGEKHLPPLHSVCAILEVIGVLTSDKNQSSSVINVIVLRHDMRDIYIAQLKSKICNSLNVQNGRY